jgi:NAD(P)-dependent dehydrogenase (short-subunit alcohol dehydrogenase family)
MGTACAGKVAIVTGASRGIGAAIARRLGAEGAAVVVTARSLAPGDGDWAGSLQETVDAIVAGGGRAVPVVADLADPSFDRAAIAKAAVDAFGMPADILVNDAAGARGFEFSFADLPREIFAEAVEVNVWAAWDLAQRVIPGMRERGAGWILNISSQQARPRLGPPFAPNQHGGGCLYGGTKAMLDRMTTGAAMDLYDDNIAVNTLAPESAVMTEHALAVAVLSPSSSEPPETMAEAALALCSGDPHVLTGRVAYSLSLLKQLQRPVHTLDGERLVAGWQPSDIADSRIRGGYLMGQAVGS